MNLHPDIRAIVEESGRTPTRVVDPSPGLWGGDPIPGLVTVWYACDDACDCGFDTATEHAMLFGPRIVQFSDRDRGIPEVVEPGTFTLYAD